MTTRADIAALAARALSSLATDAGLSAVADGTQAEGDYTDAIDGALRGFGLVDDAGLPDVSRLTFSVLDDVIFAVQQRMLARLQMHYATLVDIKVGDREEKLSQIRAAVGALTTSGGSRRIVTRPLRYVARDYELGDEQ